MIKKNLTLIKKTLGNFLKNKTAHHALNSSQQKTASINNNEQLQPTASFFKTLILAIIFAGIIRSFLFEPFHIPSGSMKPTLLIGEYVFVKKYAYGYSHFSFPFSLNFFSGRIFAKTPERGDVAVFRYPLDTKINYIKRIIGLPDDKIQMRNGILYINDQMVKKEVVGEFNDLINNQPITTELYLETFPNGKKIHTLDLQFSTQDNTGIYHVPQGHYFVMGDNRDNSQDSRFLDQLGFVADENLIGKASLIFFSISEPFWKFWLWPNSIRFSRIFTDINDEKI